MPFKFTKCELEDIVKISPVVFNDSRGMFFEAFKKSDFEKHGIAGDFVQQNCSSSEKNVLRGLHYQLEPHAQGKLIQVKSGEIFDVAVDIRKNSPTFAKWVGVRLNSEKHEMLWIPQGFAHGFLVLSDHAEVTYMISGGEYSPQAEGGIIWNDSEINIKWPVENPLLSEKDIANPSLKNAEINFIYKEKK